MTDGRTGDASSRTTKEWNAAAYHRLSDPQFAWGLKVLDRLVLTGNERVLDAGCGSGRLTREVAARVPNGFVMGCDLSENMTRAAAATLGKEGPVAVVCADLAALPFRQAFDAVFSTATFHWILNHDRLFAQLHGVLRRGGRLEAQCGGGPNLKIVHARADALAALSGNREYFAKWQDPWLFASPEETAARLERAGFAQVRCWLKHTPTAFRGAEQYRAFLESVVMRPYLSRLPTAERRRDFLDSLVEQAGTDDPPFTLDYWRLNVSAVAR